jgi:hypothetical protein
VEIPRHWRLNKQRYQLIGEVDKDGQNPRFPPKFPPKYEGIQLPPITEEEQAIEDAEAAAFVAAVHAYIYGPVPEGLSPEIHAALDESTWKNAYLAPDAPWRRLERLKKRLTSQK